MSCSWLCKVGPSRPEETSISTFSRESRNGALELWTPRSRHLVLSLGSTGGWTFSEIHSCGQQVGGTRGRGQSLAPVPGNATLIIGEPSWAMNRDDNSSATAIRIKASEYQ
ncbi:uncharacterized protein CLUP02_15465 [Colletotrichum lupini]|uniref:Uncharacterized protein n=1 Tax=Colletotrichum lupini TaxID=145971 RepID=A0A9Q8WNK0_9PEZI|nr:uncharacterized protein CLUP02_15465 [Colletotrichum lupini]UQC89934.1 hypothetical protein CLUP02_15465 [Colletotrichum lupini]